MEEVRKARDNFKNYLQEQGIEVEYTGIGVDNFTKKNTIRVGVKDQATLNILPKMFEGFEIIM